VFNVDIENHITDQTKLQNYQTDESSSFKGCATELYLPKNEQEISHILKGAPKNKKFITISGGGTGVTGARVPVYGGAVLSLEKMTKPSQVLSTGFTEIQAQGYTIYLNQITKKAICPASIPLAVLDHILADYALSYPPDPTEMTATLGGTIATNASGARSFYYGATRKWVEALRVVLPTGEIIEVNKEFLEKIRIPDQEDYDMPKTKNAAGLCLSSDMRSIDLFIGSEGILGLVTDITIKLIERNSEILTILTYFKSKKNVLDFVDTVIQNKLALSLEFFDAASLDFLRPQHPRIPSGAQAALLFELFSEDDLEAVAETMEKYEAYHEKIIPYNKVKEIQEFRHCLPESINEYVRTRVGKIASDIAVPHAKFREMMTYYETISKKLGIPFLMFGHIGNDHLHLNYLPENAEQLKKAKAAYAKILVKAVALGGTVSAEHGVGKKQILHFLYGPKGLAIIQKIKKQFDPNLILNIGNMGIFPKLR
jgi:D-lactate dehydrogenase (cytochrome)